MTNDDIWGMTIDEYCNRHGFSIEDLINKVKLDIEILKERIDSLDGIMDPRFETIYKFLSKKRKHLNRLEEWRGDKDG